MCWGSARPLRQESGYAQEHGEMRTWFTERSLSEETGLQGGDMMAWQLSDLDRLDTIRFWGTSQRKESAEQVQSTST